MKKQFTFQALLTPHEGHDGDPCEKLGPAPRRMVLRGHNDESHKNQIFTVLVSCDDDAPFHEATRQRLVTLRLAGEDIPEYLGIGSQFDLWLGSDIGKGVITRRLFV